MNERNWTDSQRDAIEARGGTLLVSAAAGSGKTAVLVQRVIKRITDDKNPTDADRLLVVTFTKAAAAEMRVRIAAQISKLLEKDPFSVSLQRQQILLTRAHICTIDSFCNDIVKENFYKLGISPDFRILDESEMTILRADAVSQVMEEFYAENDSIFYSFVEVFASGKNDDRIAQIINKLYDFVRSHPFPKRWLEEKEKMYELPAPVSQTAWAKTIFSFTADAVDYCISITENAVALMKSDPAIADAYSDAYSSDLAGLESLKEAARSCDWDRTAFQANNFSYQKLKPLRGYGDDPLKSRVSAARKEVKDTVSHIAGLFCATQEQCGEDIARLAPIVKKLFEAVLRFSEILDKMKAERRAADFSDLEHWTLKLLVKDTENGFERTEYAKELSLTFDEIMVDEYQDTNEAQEMIFRAVSQNEANLFFVGDVKQSIYRFRQAMPQIFLRRRAECREYDRNSGNFPACVVLDKNFRSSRGVTGVVNFVFRQLMSKQTGELDYTKAEELVPAADYPPCPEPAAKLDIIDLSNCDDEIDMIQAESRHIAELIHKMVKNKYMITDHGVQRPVVYRDFCILLRSANQYAHEYARELTALAIPAWADTAGGFFAAYEVGIAISLLNVIDNPMQDIPLLSVMMSPIYGFTPDDTADIRLNSRSGRLYPALRRAAESGNSRAAEFLNETECYRTLAATMPTDRLIRMVYEKTGLLDLVQAMPNGELRLANLRLLLEYAKKYEASGYGGLSGFLRFIERLRKNNADLSSAASISEAANVVKIMSVHHSKGLEFPVCIIAGCARAFHKERDDTLLHPELGLGVKLKDPETGSRFTTMPREAVALELERDEMSEELRILYVAMTRAKEKLIMVTTLKKAEKTIGGLASHLSDEKRIQPYAVRGASSISDWLLLCALRHPDGKVLRDMVGAPPEIVVGAEEPWSISVVYPPKDEEKEQAEKEIPAAQPNPELLDLILSNINYKYPYAGLNGVCAKVAASDLAAREFSARYAAVSRPAFLSETGLTSAERGTALHDYMQFADYQTAVKKPCEELERLVREGYLTAQQGKTVDIAGVEAFFQSGIGRRILKSKHMEREYRFAIEIPAEKVKPELKSTADLKEETVVLQGAVDCAFEESGKLIIVDYKTDRTKKPAELWDRYREQLSLYKLALQKYTGIQVGECLLYSFALNSEVTGELPDL